MISSLRIMISLDFPPGSVRLWDGSGPYIDSGGNLWKGVVITEGLDAIEAALNGEAATVTMGISGVSPEAAEIAWLEYMEGDVVGSLVRIYTLALDDFFQPAASADRLFTGTVDNILFDDSVSGDAIVSTVMIECVNRFSLRTVESGRVISDADQKARAAILNPTAPPDRIAERIPELTDKTIVWPRWS